jgi:adenosylcobinamide-GDP ribazoletransferase
MFGLFFPMTGIIVSSLVLGLFFLFNTLLFQTGITVFIILAIQYLFFNLFHFDGLLDCADAFLYNTSKEKRLQILTDKRTGAFAIFSGSIYIFLKFYLLIQSVSILNSTNSNWLWIIILFFYPLTGRIAGSIMPAIISPADDPGLAELLKEYSPVMVIVGIILSLSIPAMLILSSTINPINILIHFLPFFGGIAAGIFTSIVSKKMVGGYTGDSIGLSIEIGEILHLIIITELLGRLF